MMLVPPCNKQRGHLLLRLAQYRPLRCEHAILLACLHRPLEIKHTLRTAWACTNWMLLFGSEQLHRGRRLLFALEE